MQLSLLESRVLDKIPEEYHEDVKEEFCRFESEINRMSEEDDKIGQATLTDKEIKRAKTTNQHGRRGHTVVELQAIKAAALKYGVEDWLSYVDSSLTHEENIEIMRQQTSETIKETMAKEKEKTRWR